MQWKFYLFLMCILTRLTGQITISEVMFDPATSEYHDEFIEIFNLSYENYFDITGIKFSDSTGIDNLKPHKGGIKIAPRCFAIILDGSYFENSQSYNDVIPDSVLILKSDDNSLGSGGLSNSTAEQLMILDSMENILTQYRYSIDNEPGHSDEKISLDSSSTQNNWGNSKIPGGTPGYHNSITPLATDPGLDQSSIIIPDRIYSDESIRIRLQIFNFGISNIADDIQVSLFSDINRNLQYDIEDNQMYLENITFPDSEDVYLLEVMLPGLLAGRYSIVLKILPVLDDNIENNVFAWEVQVLDRSRSVRINEINFLTVDDEPEWIELLNVGSENINLDMWAFCDMKDTIQIDSALMLYPGQYKVLTADTLPEVYDLDDSLVIHFSRFFNLNNDGDEIRLIRPDGSWLEYVQYESDWLEENVHLNPSLERINPELYANSRMNWGPCVDNLWATPGRKNSIYTNLETPDQKISATPNPFSPDEDGIDDITIISGHLPEVKSAIRVRIFDMRGRIIRTLVENHFSGSQFNLVWDGKDDAGRISRIGIYVVYLEEIEDATGIFRKLKCSVVLAQKL